MRVELFMRNTVAITVAIAILSGPLAAQDTKPVPKDSVRGSIPGCARGNVFTAGPRNSDQVARLDVREGMHLRMNGPKKLLAEIKAHEGSMIEITGLMKKGQYDQTGINLGGGVRITPGSSPAAGRAAPPVASASYIDVESWRQVEGNCPSR
jgi:hypothetical protein